MNREPVLTVASITSLVAAVIALLVAFGLPLTNDQQNAILSVVALASPLVVAAFSRPKVTPIASPRGERGAMSPERVLLLIALGLLVLILFFWLVPVR